jgi:hypothetical protein
METKDNGEVLFVIETEDEVKHLTEAGVQELVWRLQDEVREQRKNSNMWFKNYNDEFETRKKVLRAFKSVVDVAIATSTPYTDELGNL